MLAFLAGRASDRKPRLFACHCARRVWSLLEERGRRAIEIAQWHAEGGGSSRDLVEAVRATAGLAQEILRREYRLGVRTELPPPGVLACHAAQAAAYPDPRAAAKMAAHAVSHAVALTPD
jgi:hypothetical protein